MSQQYWPSGERSTGGGGVSQRIADLPIFQYLDDATAEPGRAEGDHIFWLDYDYNAPTYETPWVIIIAVMEYSEQTLQADPGDPGPLSWVATTPYWRNVSSSYGFDGWVSVGTVVGGTINEAFLIPEGNGATMGVGLRYSVSLTPTASASGYGELRPTSTNPEAFYTGYGPSNYGEPIRQVGPGTATYGLLQSPGAGAFVTPGDVLGMDFTADGIFGNEGQFSLAYQILNVGMTGP